jgi:hypothetical protein
MSISYAIVEILGLSRNTASVNARYVSRFAGKVKFNMRHSVTITAMCV